MGVFLLFASLFLSQASPSTAIVTGRISMDDGSPLPLITTFRGSAVQFGLTIRHPDIGSHLGEAIIRTDGSFQLPLDLVADKGVFMLVPGRVPLGVYVKTMVHGPKDLLASPLVITPASAATPIQIVLTRTPPTSSLPGVNVSVPFAPSGGMISASPVNVARPSTPLQAPSGFGLVSIAQSGSYQGKLYEGAISFFRIEQSGNMLEEKRLEPGTALTFTLGAGSYEFLAYHRACDGNCGRLDAPAAICSIRFDLVAGQVVYLERVLQSTGCNIQRNAEPAQ